MRADLQNYIWRVTLDGGFGRVPITDKVKRVLDVGTGTGEAPCFCVTVSKLTVIGVWAIEFAEAHPNIEVIGTDLYRLSFPRIDITC